MFLRNIDTFKINIRTQLFNYNTYFIVYISFKDIKIFE